MTNPSRIPGRTGPDPIDPNIRFDAKVNRSGPIQPGFDTPCWLWTAAIKPNGYGMFSTGGRLATKHHQAHRWSYERSVGPIPDGLTVDHLCRVRHCVNPAHMEIVTQAVNNARGNSATAVNARKTRCPLGHELAGDNLVRYELKRGMRRCRTCYNAQQAARRAMSAQ